MTTPEHDARADQPEPGTPEAMAPVWDLVRIVERECGNREGAIHSSIETMVVATIAPLRERAEKAEKERDALGETLTKLEEFLQPFKATNAHTTPRWKSLPERLSVQDMATWAVEQATLLLRNELQHGPPDKRNRMTVSISWADEDWNLTLAIGNYEHAVEKARDEARLAVERLHKELAVVEAERDELRATLAANQKA